MKALEFTNTVVAVLVVAVILALFTPLADPARLSVGDQMARLNAGKVAADKFDYAFLQFGGGKVGRAALARLVRSDNAEIARRALDASKAENRYDIETEEPTFQPVIEAWPADLLLPPQFIAPFTGPSILQGCRTRGDCVATLRDLNGDGDPEILLATQAGLFLYARDTDGGWTEEGSYMILRCQGEEAAPDARQMLKSGALEPRPATWPEMATGGRFTSRLTATGPCRRAEAAAAR